MKGEIHGHACTNCFTGQGECPGECNISDTNARQQSFEEVARPLIKWLAENVHPHHSIIVTSTHAELLMGEIVLSTDEYLKD